MTPYAVVPLAHAPGMNEPTGTNFPGRPRVIVPVRVDPRGAHGPTRAQARGRGWRRTSHGFFVPASTPETVEQRVAQAGVLLPDGGAVTGWGALAWLGGSWFDGRSIDNARELPVTLASCAHDVRPQPGVSVSAERLGPDDIVQVDGLWVTHAPRSLLFEMRYAEDEREATVWADLSLYDDLHTREAIPAAVAAHPGWTGIQRARDALALCDENSWSPWETRMRLVWVIDAGLPRPECNRPLFDLHGSLIGIPDLIDPETGLVGEFEGRLHLAGSQRAHDLEREGVMRSHGLEYVAAVARDVVDRGPLVERLQAAYARCGRSPARRTWTLDQPWWWQPSHTVEMRRALSGRARQDLAWRRDRTSP